MKPRRLLRELERQGWTVRAGARHYVATLGGVSVAVPRNLAEGDRNLKNLLAELRRRGFQTNEGGNR